MTQRSTTHTEPPRGIPARPIEDRQHDPDMIRLQRAAAQRHQVGQRVDAVRVSAAVALAMTGIVATLTKHGHTAAAVAGLVSFAVTGWWLKPWATTCARRGAVLQEMFDTALFYLPWRTAAAGQPAPDTDVAQWSRSLKDESGKAMRIRQGWYDATSGVHYPYDVLITQEQNLGWDARLRRKYARIVVAFAIGWAAVGVTAGFAIAGSTLVEVVMSFFVPSLAVFQLAVEIYSGQTKVADERERLRDMVTAGLDKAQPGLISRGEWSRVRAAARDIQDGILRTRFETSRVPEWLYKIHRNSDEHDFAETAERHRLRLQSP